MKKEEILFTAGEFAKLHHINKRTLHYYDEIGLFSPAHKGKNGYRYYTYLQSNTLELLLTMRELGMSIEEISIYRTRPSSDSFHLMIAQKIKEVDEKIQHLKEIKKLLMERETLLSRSDVATQPGIHIVELPAEYLLLSDAISGSFDESDIQIFMDHSQHDNEHRLYNRRYGSMISVKALMDGNFEGYDCFFTVLPNPRKKNGLFQRSKGPYLRGYCIGDWDGIPKVYEQMLCYAKEHGIILEGYSFEEGINELAISSMDEYVTQISIQIASKTVSSLF